MQLIMIFKLAKLKRLKNKKGLDDMSLIISPEEAYIKTAKLFIADANNKKDVELINQKINEAIDDKSFMVDIDPYDFEDHSYSHISNLAALLTGCGFTAGIHTIPDDGYYGEQNYLRVKWNHYRGNRDRKDTKQC